MSPISKLLVLLSVLTAAGLGWFYSRHTQSSPPAAGRPSSGAQVSGPPVFVQRSFQPPAAPVASNNPPNFPVIASNIVSPTPFLLGSAETVPPMEPATVLSNMRIAIHQYQSMFGANPTGTNPEITEALNGGNSKQAKLINPESGLRINGRGELVDYWGTPFFFHQLSGTRMEIRSAGPDLILWTADDLVIQ